MKVLQVAAEVFPLLKTGGLADVMAALPVAIAEHGADVRLLLPGMPAFTGAIGGARTVRELGPMFGAARVRLLLARMPGSDLPVYLIDAPYLYRRGGGPYQDANGVDWADNLQRFALLGWIAAHLAAGELDDEWVPDIVHAHDWHAAMVCAYLSAHAPSPVACVYTVHNLAFQGVFPLADWHLLGLSSRFAQASGIEFHGQLSFMKAGLKFADRVTTVSPTYAGEIATTEFGAGLDGVIRSRGADVVGVLNGIDGAVWNPATDPALASPYDAESMARKAANRAALQRECGLGVQADAPLLAIVSRLSAQKGLDLVLTVLPEILRHGGQIVVQGTGDAALEAAFAQAARAHPESVALHAEYDEARAHRIIGGADMILVPSRFEPCGLTQLYGLRYGTLPLVRRVGGLADTVVDGRTGFSFDAATPFALQAALERAFSVWGQPNEWRTMVRLAMAQTYTWAAPARRYLELYADALNARRAAPPPAT